MREAPKNVTTTENTPPIHPAAMTEAEAAQYCGVTPSFLRQNRHYGNRPGYAEGPPFIRIGGGRSIRYLRSDLDDWLMAHRHHPTAIPEEVSNHVR